MKRKDSGTAAGALCGGAGFPACGQPAAETSPGRLPRRTPRPRRNPPRRRPRPKHASSWTRRAVDGDGAI